MDKLIISILGVVLGFVLSQLAEWFKSIQRYKKQRKSIRRIFFLEIKKNYRLLYLFWNQIKESAQIDDEIPADPAEYPIAHYISITPFPHLSTTIWETHLSQITSAYDSEEITKLWGFYEDISQLDNLSKSIKYLRESAYARESAESGSIFPTGKIAASMHFNTDSKNSVEQFVTIIEGILKYSSLDEIVKP
jgi:hypothetical protein